MFWEVFNAPNTARPTAIRIVILAVHFAVFPAAMGVHKGRMLGGLLAIEQASNLNRQRKFQLRQPRHRQRKDCAARRYSRFFTDQWSLT